MIEKHIGYIFLVDYNKKQPFQHSSFIHCPKSSQAMVTVDMYPDDELNTLM